MANGRSKSRLYYKIGEACKKLGIQPYVLRYWETEFPALNPNKSKSGQRVYSVKELEIIQRIKELLYEEGYTIAGAKKRLETELSSGNLELGHGAPAKEAAASDSESGETEASLDTDAAERIKTLRRGIEAALEQTRELMGLLDSHPSHP
ncbi:MAG: MerR family transcriptional regulator [Acidobacteria bacterium]|nr:MerR family transcriptional regulator [Acidobacteriota bacterium]